MADLDIKIYSGRPKPDPQQFQVTKEEFLNLLKLASDKMKAGSAVQKDA